MFFSGTTLSMGDFSVIGITDWAYDGMYMYTVLQQQTSAKAHSTGKS